jgi:hypothetical protein
VAVIHSSEGNQDKQKDVKEPNPEKGSTAEDGFSYSHIQTGKQRGNILPLPQRIYSFF